MARRSQLPLTVRLARGRSCHNADTGGIGGSPAEDGEYYETSEYEEGSFWPNLASKLAHRDLPDKELLMPELATDEEKRRTGLFGLFAEYEEELAENGLDNFYFGLKSSGVH